MLKHILLNIFLGLILVTAATLAQSAYGQNLGGLEANRLNYTEGDGLVKITNRISVSDNEPISYATVFLSEGYLASEDTLIYDGDAPVYPIFDDEKGELLLLSYPAGTAVGGAEMQAALRSVFYLNTNEDNPSTSQRTLTFTAYQSNNMAGNPVSRNITTRGRNDAPVIRSPANTPVVVNSLVNTVPIASDLQVLDVDNEVIVGARVDITRARFSDQLVFSDRGDDNIRIQRVEGSNSRLVLSGRDTKVNYQEALRSIGIQNLFTARGFKGNRLIIMQVTDSDGEASDQFGQYIHVAAQDNSENIPPSIADVSSSSELNQPILFQPQQFQEAYNDAEQSPINFIRIISLPIHGTLTLDGVEIDADYLVRDNGIVDNSDLDKLRYIPDPGYIGLDQFKWNATDGDDFAANPAYVIVSVNEENVPLLLEMPSGAEVDEDGVTTLPALTLQSAPSTTVNATLTVESGTLGIDPIILPFVEISGENTDVLIFSGSAQALRYALSGVQYRPAANVTGSDLLSVSVVSTTEQESGVLTITIIPIDDPVVLSGIELDTLLYVENSLPVAMTSQLILIDPDGAVSLKSASVSIPQGLNEGEDQLMYELTGGITATLNENQLDFEGEGSLGQYQSVLRSLTYQNLSDDPQTDLLTFEYQVIDENDSMSNVVYRALRVVPVDDSTLLTSAEPELLSYVLGNEAVPMYASLMVSDVDSDSLAQMIVSFATGYDPALDSILVTLPENMELAWDEAVGQLEISGKNSLQAYQTIARSLRYQSTAENAQTNRQVVIQVFSAGTPSNQLLRTIQLIENAPPIITSFNKKVAQNGASGFTSSEFLSNYTDSDNSPTPNQFGSLRIISLPTQGVLTLANDTITQSDIDASPDGFFLSTENIEQLLYRPNVDYLGEDQWTWNAFDGAELAEDSALVSFTVVPALSSSLSDTVICPGETLELTVEVLSGEAPYTFSWFCDREGCQIQSGQNEAVVAVSPVETTQYIVQITSSQGLDSIQDTVFVQAIDCSDVPLEIPSAFTPNGDGFNDYWELPNAGIFSSVQVAIYDRFGKSIFESSNYQNDWDGTYRGKELPAGSYYYSIVVPRELQEYTGTVTLLR
ncbi:MAG: gliding motility-associated C-terminal domain-containing protein [Bacteroidota bacterium]